MSKIAIISQPDEGVLIDVSGCTNFQEAIEHLSSTLQVSSQFWKGVRIALNLGSLDLGQQEVAHVLAIARGVGANPHEVFSLNEATRDALAQRSVKLAEGAPMALPKVKEAELSAQELIVEEDEGASDEPELTSVSVKEEEHAAHTLIYETQDTQDFASAQAEIALAVAQAPEVAVEPLKPVTAQRPKASPSVPAVLYLRQTLRSGQTVSHKGHLVIIGDVNPGAEVMAEGDVTVWGALRGVAHAGIGGNIEAEIRALKLQPIQIRIAHAIARSPDGPKHRYTSKAGPEVAKIVEGKIKISRSTTGDS